MKALRWSEDELQAYRKRGQGKTPLRAPSAILASPRPISKYRNQRTEVGGIKFASKREARRYQELRLLEGKAHEIEGLLYQVRFPLTVNGIKVGTYVADFTYHNKDGYQVEDCKGYRTPMYKLKKKLMFAIHGIKITET